MLQHFTQQPDPHALPAARPAFVSFRRAAGGDDGPAPVGPAPHLVVEHVQRGGVSGFVDGEFRPVSPADLLPKHTLTFLNLLQTHFAYPADGREWDKQDTRDYGRLVARLTLGQTRKVFMYLRQYHTWRPSVKDVREAVEAVVPTIAERRMFRSVADIRKQEEADFSRAALPAPPGSTPLGEGATGRDRFRIMCDNLRNRPGSRSPVPPAALRRAAEAERQRPRRVEEDAADVAAADARREVLRRQVEMLERGQGAAGGHRS